ncbi:uncharacterized protein LOC121245918 [Juglans microcarpa x Juglans regia]|uniref:uncharacterized protein LOC121245918 n=1 Tax=Juglans microcarpa x Juglans regia TaxID=2249226 RepID=UPI001B7F3138|nr:uncharacterized protein LOC121245918 [Juglans microcarpa x Juglans regia]
MRHLLVKDRSLGKVLAALERSMTIGFKELREQHEMDQKLLEIRWKINIAKGPAYFSLGEDKILLLEGWKTIPKNLKFIHKNLAKAHSSPYAMHLGGMKIYRDLKNRYWWEGTKRDNAHFIERCDTFKRVNEEHHRHEGNLQPLPIPKWKW